MIQFSSELAGWVLVTTTTKMTMVPATRSGLGKRDDIVLKENKYAAERFESIHVISRFFISRSKEKGDTAFGTSRS